MRPDVVSFWHGPLDGLRLTCLRSQVAAGHKVTVYSFDPLAGLPDGVGNAECRSDPAAFLCRTASSAGARRKLARLDHFAVQRFLPHAADGRKGRSLARRRRTAAEAGRDDPAKPYFAWERPRQLGNSVLYLPPDDGIVRAFENLMEQDEPDAGLAGAAPSADLCVATVARPLKPPLRYQGRDLRPCRAHRIGATVE